MVSEPATPREMSAPMNAEPTEPRPPIAAPVPATRRGVLTTFAPSAAKAPPSKHPDCPELQRAWYVP